MTRTPRLPRWSSRSPTAADLDLTRKAPRYAAAGVARYVVFDLRDHRAVVHTAPGPAGYGRIESLGREVTIVVLGIDLRVGDLV